MKVKEEIEKLSTQRLLKMYRKYRKNLLCNFWETDEELKELEEQINLMKSILDNREHILRKNPKIRKSSNKDSECKIPVKLKRKSSYVKRVLTDCLIEELINNGEEDNDELREKYKYYFSIKNSAYGHFDIVTQPNANLELLKKIVTYELPFRWNCLSIYQSNKDNKVYMIIDIEN
jgi:hypothetical protein